MTHANPHLAYRADIDGLRAIAVLAVVLFHAFPAWLPGGFVGVDVFFVISGYLISSIIFKALAGGDFSFADFYLRRVRRIFPALLLVILTSLALGWNVLLPFEYRELGKHAAAGLGFVANLVYWREAGYFDTAAELKPLLHLWSLGVEEQFYILWPAVAVVAWRLKQRFWMAVALLAGVSFAVGLVLTVQAPVAGYFLLPARAWELLAGALLALRVQRRGPLFPRGGRLADVAAGLGFTLCLAAIVVIDKTRAFPGWWALLPVSGAVLMIAAGERAWLNRVLLANRVMVAIGLISFPLYLWHWPLLAFVRIVLGEGAGAFTLAGAVVAALIAATLTYRLLEIPLRRRGGWQPVAGLVLTSLLVVGVATNIVVRGGLDFRLKDAQAERDARALDWTDALRGETDCEPALPAGTTGKCLQADPARQATALIIGDSHANHYYWGLSESLRKQGVILMQLQGAGCPPLKGASILKDGSLNGCRQVIDAAIDYALRTPGIETVFLGGRWVYHASGRELKDAADQVSSEMLVLPERPESKDWGRAEVFEHALDDTLRTLTAAGKRVVFLHGVPELDFHARECIAWHPNRFISRTPRPSCATARALAEARMAEVRPLLGHVLARFPQVAQFDPVPLMCDAAACYGKRDGLLLYRDDDHLSLEGSYWLARRMEAQLPALLGRAGRGGDVGEVARGL